MNPFDDPNGTFYVLVNHEEQHSLWPTFKEVPGGWKVVNGPDTRDACMKYIEENWTDITPLSVRNAIEAKRKELGLPPRREPVRKPAEIAVGGGEASSGSDDPGPSDGSSDGPTGAAQDDIDATGAPAGDRVPSSVVPSQREQDSQQPDTATAA